MSTFRPCLLPLVVTRGSDKIPLSAKFDGTSYAFMEDCITKWDEMRILQKVPSPLSSLSSPLSGALLRSWIIN